jgi:transcription antitermination factor NusG
MSLDPSNDLRRNCAVRIKAGNFANFVGYLDRVDVTNQVAVVMLVINGRGTPVELSIGQIERIEEPPGFERAKFSCKS